MKAKSIILSLIFSIIILTVSYSQNADTWTLHKEVNGIQIFSKTVDCHIESEGFHQQFVMLKFVNTTQLNQKVKWQLEAWYSGQGYDSKCATCDKDEYKFDLIVPAGGILEGSCDIYSESKLKIFSKFLNFRTDVGLERFNVAIIDVSPN
ncbi:MAG: hypothetical protein PHT69_07955 [Bacteroidales bacterium]|nr:hypothetical protein [Bacteroidales bacterium]